MRYISEAPNMDIREFFPNSKPRTDVISASVNMPPETFFLLQNDKVGVLAAEAAVLVVNRVTGPNGNAVTLPQIGEELLTYYSTFDAGKQRVQDVLQASMKIAHATHPPTSEEILSLLETRSYVIALINQSIHTKTPRFDSTVRLTNSLMHIERNIREALAKNQRQPDMLKINRQDRSIHGSEELYQTPRKRR